MDSITPATPPPASPMSTRLAEPTTQGDLTPAQASQMAEWVKQDLASGKITAEQAEKIFTDLNTPLEQRGPDMRSDEQKTLDQHFPSAKPEEYRITYADPGQPAPPMIPELRQFDESARTWMASAGMPKNIGDSLVSTIAKVAQTTKAMTADQLQSYGYAEFEKLQRAHGPALEERLRDAGRMVHELDMRHGGLKNLLNSRGIGDSALVASILIQHAAIYHARKKG